MNCCFISVKHFTATQQGTYMLINCQTNRRQNQELNETKVMHVTKDRVVTQWQTTKLIAMWSRRRCHS